MYETISLSVSVAAFENVTEYGLVKTGQISDLIFVFCVVVWQHRKPVLSAFQSRKKIFTLPQAIIKKLADSASIYYMG